MTSQKKSGKKCLKPATSIICYYNNWDGNFREKQEISSAGMPAGYTQIQIPRSPDLKCHPKMGGQMG